MIITPHFVYLHLPKTGGTFIATKLMKIHEDRGDFVETAYSSSSAAGRPNPYFAHLRAREGGYCVRHMVPDLYQHGTCNDIPIEFRDVPVIASMRNPYDRYVSQFKFGWWKRDSASYGDPTALLEDHPGFPDIGFPEFVGFANRYLAPWRPAKPGGEIPGFQTQQFVFSYCRNPDEVLRGLGSQPGGPPRLDKASCVARFLHVEDLNRELAALLEDHGYLPDEIEPIRGADRVYPPEGGRAADDRWESAYTDALAHTVRHLEQWLFDAFPAYDR